MNAAGHTRLDRYDLTRKIATGGMAEVFLAKTYGAHGFEKVLAVKRILPELARDPEFEERFIAEAKLAVRLSHANIVQVLDFGRVAGTLFLAMEYVDGVDLATLLAAFRERGELVPVPAALHIAVELARGLDFAHGRGVIHRDVSPSNILLSRAGEVKIADFGIALAQGTAAGRRIMGKWRYMSPEQTRGEPLDTRSDLFAAAAVMFELFTGDKLFSGDTPEEIAERIACMPIPRALDRRPGLPAELDDVLGRALERAPGDRPARASDIQRALAELSYQHNIVATDMDVAAAVARIVDAASGTRDAVVTVNISGEPDHEAPGVAGRADGRARAGLDTLIRRQLDPAGQPVERRTVVDDRPVTMVRADSGRDGVAVWDFVPEPEPGPVRPRIPVWLLAAGAVIGLVVWLAWPARNQPVPVVQTEREVIPDAGVPDALGTATLVIFSTPEGADVRIDGKPVSRATPVTVPVQTGRAYRVEVRLSGYTPFFQDTRVMESQQTELVHAVLSPLPAALAVRTDPPGAQVLLGDALLGVTPLQRDDLAPGSGQRLTISRSGYRPFITSVDLVAGATAEVFRELSPLRKGSIDLQVDDTWADIYLGSKKLGRAPVRGLELSEGSHTLRLHNPVSKKQAFLQVNVVAGKTTFYRTRL